MKQLLLQIWENHWPTAKACQPLPTGEGVIDAGAFNTIEVDKLFDAVNHTTTTIGQAVLFRSLSQPCYDTAAIRAKQDAVRELQSNPELMATLTQILQNAAEQEKYFYLLLYGKFGNSLSTATNDHPMIEGYGYSQYKRGVRLMTDLVDSIQSTATPSSPYLCSLFDAIKNFADTRAYSLMQGPAYITEYGIQSKKERQGSLSPAVLFVPRLIKPLIFGLAAAAYWSVKHFAPPDLFSGIPDEAIFLSPLLLLYIPIVGGFDRDKCITPLRDEYRQSPEVGAALEALGQMDELLSFIRYAENTAHPTVLPTLIDADHHRINLSDAVNPVLGKQNPAYVGNDFVMEDEKLVLVTGPNSGGKTAFCKTVTQIQLLAQTGCFVPAQAATLSVADHVFYQAPELSRLDDGEGRFGAELKRTKDIFLASTAKSLVVLDEMSEGTTFEEKMESSTNILEGFYRKGNSTLLITHNHKLVDRFVKKRMGIAKQVEFAYDAPTYKLIPGISRVSHADRVAKKIGFSKEDIENYLTGK
ncbi:hypothetical protein JCM14076_19660 [Methylosoma difficile]